MGRHIPLEGVKTPIRRWAWIRQCLAATLERGRRNASRYRELLGEYREMTAQSVRTQVELDLPRLGLKAGQAVALNLIRRSAATGDPLGGIGLFVRGPQKRRRG